MFFNKTPGVDLVKVLIISTPHPCESVAFFPVINIGGRKIPGDTYNNILNFFFSCSPITQNRLLISYYTLTSVI